MEALPASPTEQAALVAKYRTLRDRQRRLNDRLVSELPSSRIVHAGRQLGLMHAGTLTLENETDLGALADYCLHGDLLDGQSAIRRALGASFAEPGSDGHAMLEAMATTRFSLFELTDVVSGVGVALRDLLGGATSWVVDVSLGTSARIGACLATRLFDVEGLTMSTGAAVALDAESAHRVAALVAAEASERLLDPAPESRASVTRSILTAVFARAGAPKQQPVRSEKVGRNEPCRCGSGKKSKRCCAQ